MNSVKTELPFGLWEHVSLKHIEEKSLMPSSSWAARAFQKTFTNVFQTRGIQTRRRRTRRLTQRISLESLEPRQMLSVNPALSGSTASSANDNSTIAAFVSQNTIGILSTVPSAPTSVVAVSGNAQLAVTWLAPASTGGSPITDYLVQYWKNGATNWATFVHPVSTATSCTVTGLTNDTSYVFKVFAKNAAGNSLGSANSAPATPSSLAAALTPTFWFTKSLANGFTVQITNYNSSYTWAGTTTASGSVAISRSGMVSVTGVAAATSSTATITTTRAGYARGSATVTATSQLAAALTPTFGATTSTAGGFTVQIANYSPSYAWAGTATASGVVSVSGSGLVTVTGVAAGTSSTARITTTRAGYARGSATVTATSLAAALTPTFGATTSTVDGFTVQITNYNASYTWAGTATASGLVAISGSGLVTVTGVAAATSSTATITTTKANTVGGSAPVTMTSLFFAMSMVTIGNPWNVADTGSDFPGFGAVSYSYQIGTYDVTGSQYEAFLNAVGSTDTYALYNANMGTDTGAAQISRSGTAGTYSYAVMNNTGNRPITYVNWFDCARFSNWMSNGQPSGAQSNVTTENGAYNVNGATSGKAMAANATNPNTGLAPNFRMPLENEWYKAAYYSPNYGGVGVGGYWTYATQSNFAPGTTIGSSFNQANYLGAFDHTTDVGAFSGSVSFYGTFDQSGNVWQWNDLNGTTGSSRGFRGGNYNGSPSNVASSSRTFDDPARENYDIGFHLASPLAAALTPTFGVTTSTVDGFTVQIANYNASYVWAGTATASGSVAISRSGMVSVTGVAAATSSTATIATTRTGYVGGSAPVTATSLAAALTPTFGATTSTADGFTVQITNYNASYTWAGTATASGLVAISGSGLVTVTGTAAATSSTARITTTRTGYVGGSAPVTATSLAAALTPTFDATTSTADGFTVQITNYNASYTWAGTATASGLVAISGSGLVTVTGVAAETSSTATITTTKANTVGGSAPVTATTVIGAALTPTFGATTSTADGFTVQITNFDASYTWAGTATASGTIAVDGTGLVTVTGVAAGTSSTATITTTKANTVGGSAPVTATSLAAALTPTFGVTTSTVDGFTVQIANYNASYVWAGTATASGLVAISGSGLVTVTGVAAATSSTATITTTRAGYTPGSAAVTATSTYPGAFLLHSNPGATKRIFLDFDGHTTTGTNWNIDLVIAKIISPAYDIDNNTSSFSVTELANIREIWERVSEDYLPFNVDVTTEDPGIEALRNTGGSDTQWGIRAAIGGFNSVLPGLSPLTTGIASRGSFSSSIDVPCFIFPKEYTTYSTNSDANKEIANTISHEVGHTLNLVHDGDSSEAYYRGQGSGETGWAPIMGGGGTSNLTQWSNGGYFDARNWSGNVSSPNTQDDLTVITTTNGFGYRTDDFGSSIATASSLNFSNSTTISTTGIIEKNTDLDYFRFDLTVGGAATININPAVNGPNLDIQAKLFNASGILLVTSNPITTLNASFSTTLTAGTYYISIDGVGMGNPLTTGYTDYGSLGFYSITGTVPNATMSLDITRSDSPNYGAVSYSYQIGTYDVTGSQYAALLNTVGSTDIYALYNANMGTDTNVDKISQSGSSGSYTYAALNSTGNRPTPRRATLTPGTTIGSSANQANYNSAIVHVTDVGALSGSGSFYCSFDHSGNVYQWNDLNGTPGDHRVVRGGHSSSDFAAISSSSRSGG